VDLISSGQVGFCNDWHSESPGEAGGGVGGVGAPELDVVETVHLETVRFRVCSDEVFETNELES